VSERPTHFGPYRLIERLAKGGMAEIFLAQGTAGPVVLKRARPDLADKPEFKRLFEREAKIATALRHPNIVEIYESGAIDGVPYLAMEHIDGLDLMELFRRVRRHGDGFPPAIAATIAHGVASALAYARGVVHCDITPHNIMVAYSGRIALLDFGIAQTHAEDGPFPATDPHSIRGKVAYMSPEQAYGAAVDERTDVYALGAVLFELLSGRLLFRHKDPRVALAMVRNQASPRLRDLAPTVPEPLRSLVERARASDPQQRHPHALALRQALASFLATVQPPMDAHQVAGFVRRYAPAEPAAAGANADLGIRSALEAARRARGHAEAYFHLSQALPALQAGEPLRFLVLLRREQALRACGRPRERARDVRALGAFAQAHGTPAQQQVAGLRRLRFYLDLGRHGAAQRWLREHAPELAGTAELEALTCRLALARGDHEAAIGAVTRGLQICTPASRVRIRLLRELAAAYAARGELERAATTLRAALELAEVGTHTRFQANLYLHLASTAMLRDDYPAAISALRAGLVLDRSVGDRTTMAHKLGQLGRAYARLGLTERAVSRLRKALALLEPMPRAPYRDRLLESLGEALGHTNAWPDAVTVLRDAEAHARRERDTQGELGARLEQAAVLQRHLGRTRDDARALAESVLCRARAAGLVDLVCRSLHLLAAAAATEPPNDAAMTYAAEAVSMVRAGAARWDAPSILARLADLRGAAGQTREAQALWDEVRAILSDRLANLTPVPLRAAYVAQPEIAALLDRSVGGTAAPP